MSSWLARSLATNLGLHNDDDDGQVEEEQDQGINKFNKDENSTYEEIDLEDHRFDNNNVVVDSSDVIGVKEDLSELKQTITRQLWGVASFLAPPPPPPPPPPLAGMSDRREQSDRLVDRSCSSGESEEENTEYFGEYSNDEEDEFIDAVGLTEEVLAFARNIAHHPETWLDFPIEEEDFEDFDISDAQQKHTFAVEHLAPRLAALRIELCPVHMSEGYFWMVYFVLLYTRLNKHDAELLSTSQLVEARAMWRQELQKKTKPDLDIFGMNTFLGKESTHSPREDFDSPSSENSHCRYFMPQRSFGFEPTTYHTIPDIETEKVESESTEVHFIDKVIIEEDPPTKTTAKELAAGPSSKPPFLDYDEHEDDWVKDIEESEGYSGTVILMGNEEEISFSDLEDDTDCTMPME